MTNCNRFNIALSLVLFLSLSLFTSSCRKDDDKKPSPPVRELSQEIKDLIVYEGDEKAPKVVVNVQAGPDLRLNMADVDYLVDKFDTTGLLIVNVHQAQTLDSTIVKEDEITLDQAVEYNMESVEMLHKVIKYFKDQDREVYVFGASFGAFMAQELIAQKGIEVADKYLIMIGRLDMNEVMWQALAEGLFGIFEDGVTPIIINEPSTDLVDINTGILSAALGINRYTEELDDIDDLSDLTYIYGATDIFVGGLTTAEVNFLNAKNANVIRSAGGHDDTQENFIARGFMEAFGIE